MTSLSSHLAGTPAAPGGQAYALLTLALTKMKSFRCVRSFSFSNTTPSLFWTRWDLMSWRTRGWRTGHTTLCPQTQGAHPTAQPGLGPGSLRSCVKVVQSSCESRCLRNSTSRPPSTSTLSVNFCDFPILVRSPRVTSSFTCRQGSGGAAEKTWGAGNTLFTSTRFLPWNVPPPPTMYLKGLHRDGLGLTCGWLQWGRGGCGTHVLQGLQGLEGARAGQVQKVASLPLYSRQFPQVHDDSIVLLKSFEIDSVSAISQENILWLIIIAKWKVQMNSGCLVLSLSGSLEALQQGGGEPVDLGWSPTFRTLTLSEKQAPSSGVRRDRKSVV